MSPLNQTEQSDLALEQASMWCVRLSDGNLSHAESREFENWHADPLNAERLQQAVAIWRLCGDLVDQPDIIRLQADALSRYRSGSRSRWSSYLPRHRRWLGVVPVAVLFLVATTWLAGGEKSEILATKTGERRFAALNDNSKVSLDASTSLKIKLTENSREVELELGRAKFDVAWDPLRPFRVKAGDKMIVAIGTSFSVELVDKEVRVLLYEGQVEVRDRNDLSGTPIVRTNSRQMLKPGNELVDEVGSPGPGKILRLDEDQSLGWEQGMLSFEGEPLSRAAARMNRYSSRKIRLEGTSLAHIPVDGEFAAGNADAFVEGVSAINNLRVTITDTEIILRAR